jgi:hypothetical protein
MTEIRKKLKVTDQEQIIKIVLHYKVLHEQIADLELRMQEIQEKKDELLSDLKSSRSDEQFLYSRLSFDYGGEGKIDTKSMEWVIADPSNQSNVKTGIDLTLNLKTEENDSSVEPS